MTEDMIVDPLDLEETVLTDLVSPLSLSLNMPRGGKISFPPYPIRGSNVRESTNPSYSSSSDGSVDEISPGKQRILW